MKTDTRDLVTGVILAAIGAFFCIAAFRYQIGTTVQMGPGYFPMVLGGMMVLVSLGIIVTAFFRPAQRVVIEWRPLIGIIAAIAIFALSFEFLGLVPAVFLCIFAAAGAGDDFRWPSVLVLAVSAALLSWLIFPVALGQPMPPFAGWLQWNF